eukprot:TRINITY_DN5561_c0_g1_i1.p1 TRINITY_DN5561_c0_g1~~TRINITY_DN5561_c0_g1_i1.p1  ORF type:complete len:487 (-),score=73.30 TRINITY_DN5561_c0_g1_i1:107-1567(-)
MLLYEMNQFNDCLKAMDASYNIKHKTNTAYYMFKSFLALKKEPEAIEWARQGVKISFDEAKSIFAKVELGAPYEYINILISQRIEMITAQGKYFQKQGNHSEAIAILWIALEQKESWELWYLLSKSLIRLKDVRIDLDPLSAIDKAIQLNPVYTPALLEKGLLLMDQGKKVEADDVFDVILNLEPDNIAANLAKGSYFYEKYLDQVEQNKDSVPDYWARRTVEYLEKVKFLGETHKTEENSEYLFKALMILAHMQYKAKNFSQAVDMFQKAINLSPTSIIPWRMIGLIYLESGVPEEAIHRINQVLVFKPTPEMFCAQARCYLAMGETEQAFNAIEKAYEMDAQDPIVIYYRPFVLVQTSRYVESLPLLREEADRMANKKAYAFDSPFITRNEASAEHYLTHIGFAKFQLGEREKGLALMDVCLRLFPDYAPSYINKGIASFELKHYQEASILLQKGIILDSQSYRAKYYYKESCLILGDQSNLSL